MSKTLNNKIKIGVHWKNSISVDRTSPSSPRHPKLIELDPNTQLDDYITKICEDWKIPQSNLHRFALRYDDTHKFVTEQNRSQIPTGQVFYLSLSHIDEAENIIKSLALPDYHRYDSTVLERLKLAGEDETFALEFVRQNGLLSLSKLFTHDEKLNSYENFTVNLLRSLHNIMTHQNAIHWDNLESIDIITDQLIFGINSSKVVCPHSSSAMMILYSILTINSKYSSTIIQTLEISHLLDYCNKLYDMETQYYALALINVIMNKSDQSIRQSLVIAMSNTNVTYRLRELVQSIISNDEYVNNDSISLDTSFQSTRPLSRSTLVQQLCLLQRFYLNELYTTSLTTLPDRSNTKYRDMIVELRRSAFDTDLILSEQNLQENNIRISSEILNDTINPRQVEALQRDYERLGFQNLQDPMKDFEIIPPGVLSLQNLFYFCIHKKNDFIRFVLENSCKTLQQQCPLVRSAIEITRILSTLFSIGIEPNIHDIYDDYFLLFYTISSFFEQAFVRCLLLFNKTWKEMRACDADFQVVSSIVSQQISQSLDDISLMNSFSSSINNKTLTTTPFSPSINSNILSPMMKSVVNTSLTSTNLSKFTFDYFSERLNANNYKDVCKKRDEQELKKEELIMKLPIVETLKERLRSHVEHLTRQARLKTMKKGHIFMTVESRVGAKKTKSRLMYWQLLDNEKHVQCSEPPSTANKENSSTTSLTRTAIPIESIRDVQCSIDQARTGSLNGQERSTKLSRHSNAHTSVTILLQNETNYTLLCENDYDMSCWSDGFNILLHREMDSFYAREDMESLLNLLCQLQILELDSPLIHLPQHQLSTPIRLPPIHSETST